MNILHLSDLHFSRRHSHNVSVVMDALLPSLREVSQSSLRPDLVVFSGDFVQSADDADIYLYFYDFILEPIEKATGCSLSRFIFTPGNHDVERAAVAKTLSEAEAFAADSANRDALNEAYFDGRLHDFAAQKFKAYSQFLSLIDKADAHANHHLHQIYRFPELQTEFAVLNTAWLSRGGYAGYNDNGKLLYPEAAMSDVSRALDQSNTHFLLTHHPLNWLDDVSAADIRAIAGDKFQMHLYGHLHEPAPRSTVGLQGKTLENQAGALYSGRDRYIGYSLTQFDVEGRQAAVHLWAFSNQRREFHPAEQLVKGGIFYPSEEARRFWRAREVAPHPGKVATWIKESLLPKAERELNEGLTDRKLCDVFVPPPLIIQALEKAAEGDESELPERKDTELSFDEFITSKTSFVIFANSESGKTTLLKQTALRLMQTVTADAPTLPVIIEFGQVAEGRDKILRLLKASVPEEAEGWTIKQLLIDGLATIMIDDVVLLDLARMNILRTFISEYPRNRYILTATQRDSIQSEAVADPNLPIRVQAVFMRAMTRRAMRSLVGKWDHTKVLNRDDILKRLLAEMRGINVPMTAVNGTIFLTIYESETNFRPINRAVLMENFIETLLEKASLSSFERRTFDFTNQKHLLSHIACWMAKNDAYVAERSKLNGIVQDYLDQRGLPNDAAGILSRFIKAKILAARQTGELSFRYRAFLEYFIATQMRNEPSFKEWVLAEDRYLSYINEIVYYAGIDRADGKLIELVGACFEEIQRAALDELGWSPDLQTLETFKLPEGDADAQTILNEFERQVGATPLTSEEQDDILEAEMPRDVESRQEVFRPSSREVGQQMFLGLLLYSGLVRNLELISDVQKREHLNKVLHSWGVFLVASLQIVPQLAVHRRLKVNGVTYQVLVPKNFTTTQVARTIYLGMPSGMANIIWQAIGTEKLEKQLSELTLQERDLPGIITFFRNSLAADLKLGNWWKGMAEFAAKHKDSPYLSQVLLWKLRDLHVMDNVPKLAGNEVRKVVGDIVARLRTTDPGERTKVRNDQIRRLRRDEIIRKIRMNPGD